MQASLDLQNPLSCPLVAAVNTISGKWKPAILHMLISGAQRFGELRRNIPPISHRVLTQQLRELEADGIVLREVFPENPPRVEYTLSPLGHDLKPILRDLYNWSVNQHLV